MEQNNCLSIDANEQLQHFNGTENYYKYFGGLVLTDGVRELAERFKCYWLLDIIASYQPELRKECFQVWTLLRNENDTALVRCTNGNEKELISQTIPYTDFKAHIATIWLHHMVLLLPSEY
jgi:hypothetical protein